MPKLTVLLVGSGGREHALAWKLAQSPRLEKLYIAPGNAGTALCGENVSIPTTEPYRLLKFAQSNNVQLLIVGPDDSLAMGITDIFLSAGIAVFGPTQAAAQLEWSKGYAKEFMGRHNIPTTRNAVFTDFESAATYADKQSYPLVVKASGLALGKGVIIAETKSEALTAIRQMMIDKVFGAAGETVVIEEFLEGVEISIHVFSDGSFWRLFPSSQDHKRAHDDDRGLNTGGMGTISPLPFVTEDLLMRINTEIIQPTILGMQAEGRPFVGCLYPGIMLTKDGPKVLEYNVRFGDPETQSYMRLMETDLLDVMEACAKGTLAQVDIRWKQACTATIVVASSGYPKAVEKGKAVSGIDEAEKIPGVVIFYAATDTEDGNLVTSGGRVLGVSAIGANLPEAISRAYEACGKVNFHGMQHRSDIGKKALGIPLS